MSEVIEVEATVIETDLVYEPASISAQGWIDYNTARLADLMAPYSDIEKAVEIMSLKDLKASRTDVNKIIERIEEQRKEIKREYSKPLEDFESKVKEMLDPARKAAEILKTAVSDKEQMLKDEKADELKAIYEEYAPILMDVVPFEKLLNKRWLNASFSKNKAITELTERIDNVASDWETLKNAADSFAFYEECEAEFFRTLDLGSAFALNQKRIEEQARIDSLKAEIEFNKSHNEACDQVEGNDQTFEELHEQPKTLVEFRAYLTEEQIGLVLDFFKTLSINGSYRRL